MFPCTDILDSPVRIANDYWLVRRGISVRFPARAKYFSLYSDQTISETTLFISIDYRGSFRVGVKLTIHLYQVIRLRMRGFAHRLRDAVLHFLSTAKILQFSVNN